ncbi:MAG TPA: serine/threonine-protein kinase [Solirubrobacteraceae bacterium]|nr:serine/threonine-protein kinase [Solirubrobacteraceae bacterium]
MVRPRAGPAARVLDRYDLERRLGAGAHGAVWLARDLRLERPVAVKVMARGDGRPRAEREALAAARLNHPGIVSLYEAGADETAHYLVSELVDGVTLAEAEARGALSDRDVLRIGAALCDALEHAHAAGVVHRDIKPGNVIIPAEPASEAGVAKLTDFGVAHLAGEDVLTHTGDVVGTLAYMAPEQAEGAPAGPPADLYALALLLYEALAGVNPVRAAAPAATARRVAAGVPSLGRLRRDLDPDLVEAVDRALRRRPGERGGVSDLRDALREAAPDADAGEGRTLIAPEHAIEQESPAPASWRRQVAERAVAGGTAGLGAGVALAVVVAPPVDPLLAAVAVGVAVALLPRLAWIVAATAGVVWLAAGPPHEPGTALVVAVGLAACPLLLPRAGWLWSLPAAAPALAAVGLAGFWPALAGLVSRAWRRAALGALGGWWIALAEPLAGRDLFLGRASGTGAQTAWVGSADGAVRDVLVPLGGSGALALVALWAVAAVALPYALRGRTPLSVILGALGWAGALVVGTGLLAGALRGALAHPDAAGAVGGALAGAALAGGLSLLGARRFKQQLPP